MAIQIPRVTATEVGGVVFGNCPHCGERCFSNVYEAHGIGYVGNKLPDELRLCTCRLCQMQFEMEIPPEPAPSYHKVACECGGEWRQYENTCQSCNGVGYTYELVEEEVSHAED